MFRKKESSPPPRLIIGLGNPGEAYARTRHNVGFDAIDVLSEKNGIKLKMNRRFRAIIGEGRMGTEMVLLVKPQTYMNLSGESVLSLVKYYKIPPTQIVVMYDDVALPLGAIRVRERGSAGGQKGMVNIIARLGTNEFTRIRMGVGEKPEHWNLADYVLSSFTKNERETMDAAIIRAADAASMLLTEGTLATMNIFNQRTS